MLPIRLKGARTHNLRGIDLTLDPGSLVGLCGPSGAGKSSLALDTLYAEGQRRFVESFSPYARQFLERLPRPPVDELAPIAATVAVDRHAPVKSSRSTLATLADLEPYLAALFAKESIPFCADCNVAAAQFDAGAAAAHVLSRAPQGATRSTGTISYFTQVESKEQFLDLREALARDGYRRVYMGGELLDLDQIKPSEGKKAGELEVVVDRIGLDAENERRLQQAIEAAWDRGGATAHVRVGSEAMRVARGLVCPKCARSFEAPRLALFSYNSPLGACGTCKGFGRIIDVAWDKVIPDGRATLAKNAVKAWAGKSAEWERKELAKYCAREGIPMDVPWEELPASARTKVIEGDGSYAKGKFPGVRAWFKWLESRTYKMHVRVFLARYREYALCPSCHGGRLNENARHYRVAGQDLPAWHRLSVGEAAALLDEVTTRDAQGSIAKSELASRLRYLSMVGLSYLGLDRQARTLSGGEAQRASLTTALGASLSSAMFVIDEPTIGLHASDVPPLVTAMRNLSEAGNTVLVVEHDTKVLLQMDRLLELGPGAGKAGGTLLFDGTPKQLAKQTTATATALRRTLAFKETPRTPAKGRTLEIRGARDHNLRLGKVRFPAGCLTVVCGPSGSGKSTLVRDILYRAVLRATGDTSEPKPERVDQIVGIDLFRGATLVDQAPLGRTARGNAATYTQAWNRIRQLFAATEEAKSRGLEAGHFSFNVAAKDGRGRCEACAGEGYETVEMQFLADVQLECATCGGARFSAETRTVKLGGKSISDVLAMTVSDALDHFDRPDAPDYVLRRALTPVIRVGLGYLPMGQPLSTLSGGEAQRLKLARALGENAEGQLFVVDEPSAGLHAADTAQVMSALDALVASGATVVVVEHDLDVIAGADFAIELGPGGGAAGGELVFEGTPAMLAAQPTKTGVALRAASVLEAPSTLRGVSGSAHHAIAVHGAREHNLKNVACSIPHGELTVVTGPSGSGKSTLAFGVVFAEGQRRFMETLTPYARQFLPTLPRPVVDLVTGTPPSIALEQRRTRVGANSTVATVTEIAHYLRLLFAKLGQPHCPTCESKVSSATLPELLELISKKTKGGTLSLYARVVSERKGTHLDVFTHGEAQGITTARVDGALIPIEPPPKLARSKEHSIDFVVYQGPSAKLDEATLARALAFGDGIVRYHKGGPNADASGDTVASTERICTNCGTGIGDLDPRFFSFNTKQGQCPRCEGSGLEAIPPVREGTPEPPERSRKRCIECDGARLGPIPRRVRLFGHTYPALTSESVRRVLEESRSWKFEGRDALVGVAALGELRRRLAFVDDIGLAYLALSRRADSLSGGEMQRLRLSAQLGSGLTGTLYVLDEPTIGLHPRDTVRLIKSLRALTQAGSTVLVVEHDADTIRAADHLIDMGPSGGSGGGNIIADGKASDVLSHAESPTAIALSHHDAPKRERRRVDSNTKFISLEGATEHNLKDVTFRVPTGHLVAVVGVSGSGKSTLVRDVFYPALRRSLSLVSDAPGAFRKLSGSKLVDRALAVDQSPIGRSPRSTPATFLGVWDEIRALYAGLPEAKMRGFNAARFSFNAAKGGRCSACGGAGVIVSEMAFMPDVVTVCETCNGMRFERATLDVKWKGLSIGDVLALSAADAARMFSTHLKIGRPLATLDRLGVGYITLGQGSHTLSGGEAQRLKLAAELTESIVQKSSLYVLDEPTTGLHVADVRKLVHVLGELVTRGDTLVVIEHHLDVIEAADYVIELGPEGGEGGGRIVFEGSVEALRKAKTATGAALRALTVR
ncbi:MAG: excinuclease ABC subunit UvrA [Polyangiaceae bacterium]